MKILNKTFVTITIREINHFSIITIILIILIASCKPKPKEKSGEELREIALKICQENIVLDSHIDWPEQIIDHPENISERTAGGDFDLVRAKEGGLNAALSVIYVNSRFGVDEGRIMADSMLRLITGYAKSYPGKFALAGNPEDIRRNFKDNLFSFVLCLENGSPIGNDLNYLKYLKEKGIVYITLCHNKANQISDSNFDTNHKWNGLSPFGKEVIRTMNQSGIMIDISHSTDSTVFQSVRYSKAPVIASHSSCRYFTPGLDRNLPDTLIKAIAGKNGIIMVNLCSGFLDPVCLKNWMNLEKWYDSTGIDELSKEGVDFTVKYGETHKLHSNSKQLVDHIDHIVKLVGVNYVGIGSDFDGIGLSQPSDLPDVSSYPVIVFELLKRGYTEENIKKILSENFLRVWNRVNEIADSLNKSLTN